MARFGRRRAALWLLPLMLLAAMARAEPTEKHWAFQPLAEPPLPAVQRLDEVETPIDRFILAKIQAQGLALRGRASKVARQAREIEAFARDTSPHAFARVVERLLNSPRYGERWGRHWLDLARYADSNGMDENLAYASAWRYRDYVIASFNRNKPYDQFLREQIAGDLMGPAQTKAELERVVATGFLTIGPKMLAEDDPMKMEMDIVDEQLDTVCRTFMGMTVGCARCHDHKFDPVPTSEYYAMAGIFKSTKTMDNFKVVARWQERPLGTTAELEALAQHRERIEAQQKQIGLLTNAANAAVLNDARGRAADYLAAAQERRALEMWMAAPASNASGIRRDEAGRFVLVEAEAFQRAEHIVATQSGYGEGIGVIYGEGGVRNWAEYDVPVEESGMYRVEIRYAAAAARPIGLSINGQAAGTNLTGKVTGSWNPDTQTWEVATQHQLEAGTNVVRLERADCIPHLDKILFVRMAGRDAGEQKLIPEFVLQWAKRLAKEGSRPEPGTDAFAKLVDDPKGPFQLPATIEAHYPTDKTTALAEARTRLKGLLDSSPALPEAMAVADGSPQDLKIHKRGSHWTLGDEAKRSFLHAIGAAPGATIPSGASGRLELADWLARADHPLTARVMANRLWHWHFGEGLVRSPDNFGLLGEKPSHPELLDWLARRFIASGWDIKAMHRLIMASAVYQRASGPPSEEDPDNRLLAQFPRRRLEVEAIRDSILYVSGGLEEAMGGTQLPTANRAYVTSTANKEDASIYLRPIRSVYLPVIRSALYNVFQVFDFADPSGLNGRRDRTTVASQALFMMNSKLVAEAAGRLARRVLGENGLDDAGRVEKIYRIAYSRAPDETERAAALGFVARYAAGGNANAETQERAWQSLCRTALAANEFVFMP
jgi:Protein of unknown function (DUF1553)/Protein of unknown function (DUF1549)